MVSYLQNVNICIIILSMPLPISIDELLTKQRVESSRIEFKEGWNPGPIYRSICAFANDFDNLGGGYILIGVKEENGKVKRPVIGIEEESLDRIQRDIQQFNNLIRPFYAPKISIESVDDKSIIVLWVPAGNERPYEVPAEIKAKQKAYKPYIRYGSNTIEAKGDLLDELRELKDRTPFDERGNLNIQYSDISMALLRDHLSFVGSRLEDTLFKQALELTFEQMNLLYGPSECRMIKNVAAMMFSENMSKFFPMSQVEVVLYPNGRIEDPDNFIEMPVIRGTVPQMIRKTLDFLKISILRETITKSSDKAESKRVWNYPYQALEEAVVNALFHRDYKVKEPVEISIEPSRITILSYSGPDRSITNDAIQKAQILRSRRYRNRNLGEYLKELRLTEGRATGIPTIQKELHMNGSDKASIETDEERTYFLIDIPCHSEARGLWERDYSKIAEEKNLQKNLQKGLQKRSIHLSPGMFNVLLAFAKNPVFSQQQIASSLSIEKSYVIYCVSEFKKRNILHREGGRKFGRWVVTFDDSETE